MKKIFLYLAVSSVFLSCKKEYSATKNLTDTEYTLELEKLAPYVIKKNDQVSFENRFRKENLPYYKEFISVSEGKLTHYYRLDTAYAFVFQYKDRSSLYEHYRAIGGYYRKNEKDSITFLNLLFHTPRLTKVEIAERVPFLFKDMVNKGNVARYHNNKAFIQTPNKDFYYNTKYNRWDYTPNSSWKFLKDVQRDTTDLNN
ncbi:MAG: hypothetical protein ACK5QK_11845 [Chryseotalea sp.]|jgi:hypothetical protein